MEQRKYWLYAFWKRFEKEEYLAFGLSKPLFNKGILILIVLLVAFFSSLFLNELRVFYSLFPVVLFYTAFFIYKMDKSSAWFQVDQNGKIINKFSNGSSPPEEIKGRKPMGRKKFNQSITN